MHSQSRSITNTVLAFGATIFVTLACNRSDAERVRQLEASQAEMAKQLRSLDSARQDAEQRAARASENSTLAAAASREQARLAITAVLKPLSEAVDILNSGENPRSPEGARQRFADFHVALASVAVYSCPLDFREQHRRLVTAARLLTDAAEQVPANAFEALLRGLEQSNSPNPDISGNRAERVLRERYETFLHELQERVAVANSHGVS